MLAEAVRQPREQRRARHLELAHDGVGVDDDGPAFGEPCRDRRLPVLDAARQADQPPPGTRWCRRYAGSRRPRPPPSAPSTRARGCLAGVPSAPSTGRPRPLPGLAVVLRHAASPARRRCRRRPVPSSSTSKRRRYSSATSPPSAACLIDRLMRRRARSRSMIFTHSSSPGSTTWSGKSTWWATSPRCARAPRCRRRPGRSAELDGVWRPARRRAPRPRGRRRTPADGSCWAALSERLMRSRLMSTSSTCTSTSSPTATTEPGWSTASTTARRRGRARPCRRGRRRRRS